MTTGGDLIARMLAAEDVGVVFGIIDGSYFGLYSALHEHGIRLISPRHETSAVHMAGAYARMTGKLGVCIASNGPGVANALPGVAVENAEGNRVLLITSTRRSGIVHPDRGGAFQCFDQVAVTGPMTKWSGYVPSHERIPELMHRALRASFMRRPGVVHVDVPEDIVNGKFTDGALLPPERYRATAVLHSAHEQVERAAEMLLSADDPLIHAGSGVVHARAFEPLRKLSELLSAPVTTSWGGRGAISERSELSIPMPYVELNNRLRNAADVVLILGSRVGETDWWGKPPYWRSAAEQQAIQVDIDEEMLGLNKPVDLAIHADIGDFLDALLRELQARDVRSRAESRRAKVADVVARKRSARAELDKALTNGGSPVHPALIASTCQRVFADDAVLVMDGGNTVIWANFYHEARTPNSLLTTFKFGMLGAGVSQALGAKVARPDRQVYCIIGDGAMGFHSQEIETAVRNGLAVTYIVMCDRQWGMVKMNQQFALKPLKTLIRKSLGPGETINADLGEIRFDRLAEAMGAHGERVSSYAELEPALRRCLAANRCAVVHVDVDPVKHMWAPKLKVFKDMHAEPAG